MTNYIINKIAIKNLIIGFLILISFNSKAIDNSHVLYLRGEMLNFTLYDYRVIIRYDGGVSSDTLSINDGNLSASLCNNFILEDPTASTNTSVYTLSGRPNQYIFQYVPTGNTAWLGYGLSYAYNIRTSVSKNSTDITVYYDGAAAPPTVTGFDNKCESENPTATIGWSKYFDLNCTDDNGRIEVLCGSSWESVVSDLNSSGDSETLTMSELKILGYIPGDELSFRFIRDKRPRSYCNLTTSVAHSPDIKIYKSFPNFTLSSPKVCSDANSQIEITNLPTEGAVLTIASSGSSTPVNVTVTSSVHTRNIIAGYVYNINAEYTANEESDHGCSLEKSITVKPKVTKPTISIPNDKLHICSGAIDGYIQVSSSASDLKLYKNNAVTSDVLVDNKFSGLDAGTYYVKATNDICNTNSEPKTVYSDTPTLSGEADPPTCHSSNNGTKDDGIVELEGESGIAPYAFYRINGATWVKQSSHEIIGLQAATYNFGIIDACGSSDEAEVSVSNPSQVTLNTDPIINQKCYNNNNGEIPYKTSGGVAPHVVTISPSSEEITKSDLKFSTLFPNNYSITVEDNNGCSATISNLQVSSYTNPSIEAYTITPVACHEEKNGSLNITNIIKGTSGILKSISITGTNNGEKDGNDPFNLTKKLYDGLHADTYTINIIDKYNCSFTDNYIVTQPDPLSITSSRKDHVDCVGGSDGQINATITGGNLNNKKYKNIQLKSGGVDTITNYSYTDELFSKLAKNNYFSVYIEDKKGCNNTFELPKILEPEIALSFNPEITQVISCATGQEFEGNNKDGIVMINVTAKSGWFDNYRYAIKHPGSLAQETYVPEPTYESLKAGNYEFYVKDAGGCIVSKPLTLSEPTLLSFTHPLLVDEHCEDMNNGSISLSVSGSNPGILFGEKGYTLALDEMTADSTDINYFNIAEGSLQTFDSLPPSKNYRITVTDRKGCNLTMVNDSLRIEEYTNPYILYDSVQSIAVDCKGNSTGQLLVQEIHQGKRTKGADSIIYDHYSIGIKGQSTNLCDTVYDPFNLNTTEFDLLLSDWYDITINDFNQCSSTIPIFVEEPEFDLSLSVIDSAPVQYKYGNSGIITFQLHGGNIGEQVITASDTSGNNYLQSSSMDNKAEISNFYAGELMIELEDKKACKDTLYARVLEPEFPLGFKLVEKNDARCKAEIGNFEVQGVGGWGKYTYTGADRKKYYALNKFDDLTAGMFHITVKDSMQAIYSDSVMLYEPADSLQAYVNTEQTPTCQQKGSIGIQIFGGTAPYQLIYQNDTLALDFPYTQTYVDLEPGAHQFNVIDSLGCKYRLEHLLSDSLILKLKSLRVVQSDNNIASPSGIMEVEALGGVGQLVYEWRSLSDDFISIIASDSLITQAKTDYYQVTVREAAGCYVNDIIRLPFVYDRPLQELAINHESKYEENNGDAKYKTAIENPDQVVLMNASLQVNRYDSSEIIRSDSTLFFEDLSPGKYLLQVSNALSETEFAEFVIDKYEKFVFLPEHITAVKRSGESSGKISIATGGGRGEKLFNWQYLDDPSIALNTMDGADYSMLSNAPGGNYLLSVEDEYGNPISQLYVIPEPAYPLSLSWRKQDVNCKDSSDAYLMVDASGGWGEYQYGLDTVPYYKNGKTWFDLEARPYAFYVMDKMGVVDTILYEVTEPDYLQSDISFIDSVNCKGEVNGAIHFNVSGGTAPYRSKMLYDEKLWNRDTIISGLPAGEYIYHFTDLKNCIGTDTLSLNIHEPDTLILNDSMIVHSTCDLDNGILSASMQGGTKPYSYAWTDADNNYLGTDSMVQDLEQLGLFYLNVLDNNRCLFQWTNQIRPSTKPRIRAIEKSPVICWGDTTGTATVTQLSPAEPFAPYHLQWSNKDTGSYSPNFYKGTHWVSISDTNHCETFRFFDISSPDSLYAMVIDSLHDHCYGYNNAFVNLLPIGGVGGYAFNWSHGDTAANAQGLFAGTYNVMLKDTNLCEWADTFTINEPPEVVVKLDNDIEICPLNIHTLDGHDFAAHQWSNTEGVFSEERFVYLNDPDTYNLRVTNDTGCFGYDDFILSVGNSALEADFIMSSESHLGDTLHLYELSNLPLDSMYWEYNDDVFLDFTETSDPDYMLKLRSYETGVYNIGLMAYTGGCISKQVKQVEIIEMDDSTNSYTYLGYNPLIETMEIGPNPTDGEFMAKITLREPADIQLAVYSVDYGEVKDLRKAYGLDYYEIPYNLFGIPSGVYVIIVTARNERQQTKLIFK